MCHTPLIGLNHPFFPWVHKSSNGCESTTGVPKMMCVTIEKISPLISTQLRENFIFNLVHCLLIFSSKYINLSTHERCDSSKQQRIYFPHSIACCQTISSFRYSLVNQVMNLCCSNRLIIDFKLSILITYSVSNHIGTLS